ncbi:MAG: neutral zinc metallopeptidase [Chloroflexota bacterium]|nr:neutral zinc metallopeptidase [Chloroflexota bacterium]
MDSVKYRFARLVIALLVLTLGALPGSGESARAIAQSAVDGNSYTSPTFGYSATWDDQTWVPTAEYAAWNYTWLTLEAATSSLWLEGLYAYYGDAEDCFEYELQGIEGQLEVEQLSPLDDSEGNPWVNYGNGWASGMFALPDGALGNGLETALYLECITLIPDFAVLIVTGYFDRALVDVRDSTTLDVLRSVTLSSEPPSEPDLAEYDAYIWSVSDDIDAFWADTLAELGYTFEPPTYEVVVYPTELDCGGETSVQEGASYCDSSQTITIGDDEFLSEELPVGLGVAEYILGHEMGHHIYHLLGLGACDINDCRTQEAVIVNELTADCLSGAWMQDAVATGFFDEEVVWRTEFGVRYRIGTSPGDADHGTPEQSMAAFNAGYEGGLAACVPA